MDRRTRYWVALWAACMLPGFAAAEAGDVERIEQSVQRFYLAYHEQELNALDALIGPSMMQVAMGAGSDPRAWRVLGYQARAAYLEKLAETFTDQQDEPPRRRVEVRDVYLQGDQALAFATTRPDSGAGDVAHDAWVLARLDDAWRIVGAMQGVDLDYEPVRVPARDDGVTLRFYLDGNDRIHIDREGVWFEHEYGELPGRWDGHFYPSEINGADWQPLWKGDTSEKALFTAPLAWPEGAHFRFGAVDARDLAHIVSTPDSPDDTLSIVVQDWEGGADWYDIEVLWDGAAPPAKPPGPLPGREDLLLEVLFDGEIRDSSGAGRGVAAPKVALGPDRAGRPDRAGLFDRSFVSIDAFALAGPFAVSAWVRYDWMREGSWHSGIFCQDGGGDSTRVFQLSTEYDRLVWHRMHEKDVRSNELVETGRWYHVAAVYDGDFHKLYVDGRLSDYEKGSLLLVEQPLHIGTKNPNENYFLFKGSIDDVRLYGRALNADEIWALANEEPGL